MIPCRVYALSLYLWVVWHTLPNQFDDDFYEFRCSIKELERRLGAVVSLAFDDCATVYGRFKLLDSFEGLLERPIIQVIPGDAPLTIVRTA